MWLKKIVGLRYDLLVLDYWMKGGFGGEKQKAHMFFAIGSWLETHVDICVIWTNLVFNHFSNGQFLHHRKSLLWGVPVRWWVHMPCIKKMGSQSHRFEVWDSFWHVFNFSWSWSKLGQGLKHHRVARRRYIFPAILEPHLKFSEPI